MDFFMDCFKIKKRHPLIDIVSVFFSFIFYLLLKEFVYVESYQPIDWFSKYSS